MSLILSEEDALIFSTQLLHLKGLRRGIYIKILDVLEISILKILHLIF